MNTLIPLFGAFLCLFVGYRFYSNYLVKKVFCLDDEQKTPAHTQRDGIDYEPARTSVLFSHHFASIAGLSPIVGPAIAVVYGWLPAILWLLVGAILMGAVHDMSALVISMRNQGRSIGDVCEQLIGKRARILFLLMIYIALALAMGAFTAIVANLLQMPSAELSFSPYPEASLPAVGLIFLAMVFGILMRKKLIGLKTVSVLGLGLSLFLIYLGAHFSIQLNLAYWEYTLLGYAFIASILPVWLLLQPRDFINTLSLYLGLFVLFFSIVLSAPSFTAPAINTNADLSLIFPLLFVTIACGAVSGFHNVVSSGTTAKQISCESDARPVGYGAMLLECLLGIAAVIACTAGLQSSEMWYAHYGSESGGTLYGSIAFFVQGSANLMASLGVPEAIGSTFVALLIVSFALTTLDSGTRILRYNVEELAKTFALPVLANRYISSALAVGTIAFFALSEFGKTVWILFGTVNQLLAALGLLAATVYLVRLQRNFWVTAIPMVFMMIITITAMTQNLQSYYEQGSMQLLIVGGFISFLVVGLILESLLFFFRWRTNQTKPTPAPANIS